MAGVHIKAVYTRTRSAGTEDVAITTHDLWFGPDASSEPTVAQMDAMAVPLKAFWDQIAGSADQVISAACRLIEFRFYIGYDGDGSPGAVDYVKTYSVPGFASAAMCPPQIACTVTELTDSRKHWGRFYIPGIASSKLASDGTLLTATVNAIALAAETCYEAWGAISNVTPIVWSRSSHPISYLGVAPPRWRPTWVYPSGTVWDEPVALAVQSIRVDEILDVQRRRRYEATQTRVTKQLA